MKNIISKAGIEDLIHTLYMYNTGVIPFSIGFNWLPIMMFII